MKKLAAWNMRRLANGVAIARTAGACSIVPLVGCGEGWMTLRGLSDDVTGLGGKLGFFQLCGALMKNGLWGHSVT